MVTASPGPGSRCVAIGGYLAAAALAVLILGLVLEIWNVDLRALFCYCGETLSCSLFVQGTVEHGWYLHNDRLGAPLALDLRDYPLADGLHILIIHGLSRLVDNPSTVFNLYYLLTFPLTALTGLLVLRHFGCSYGPALVASLLFAFMPFHFFRYPHLFYTGYFLVPLLVMVVLWLHRAPLAWRSGKFLASVSICALVGLGGIYYACFGCFFLLLAGALAAGRDRALGRLGQPALMIGVIIAAGLVNLTPYFISYMERGHNPENLIREWQGGELYGLKVPQLLLPVTGHRFLLLAKIKGVYNRHTLSYNENDTATLGAVGSLALLFLLGYLLVGRRASGPPSLLEPLAVFSWAALLLATTGGLAGLLTFLCPSIRAYNRMSVYIGFFAFFAVGLGLHHLQRKLASLKTGRLWNSALLTLVLVVGICDQTPGGVGHYQDSCRDEWRHDAAFIRHIEAALPSRAMVFQLPFVPFPENGPVEQMQDYDHLRGYVHSKQLRWSYPTMRGRPGHAWQERVAAQEVDAMVPILVQTGFQGIYINRLGYPDRAADLEAKLSRLLQAPPLVSPNGRLVFFDLTKYHVPTAGRDISGRATPPLVHSVPNPR